jgi:hypothetical protein
MPAVRLTADFRAPSRTRTDTVRILSPLPLPIGLWGLAVAEHATCQDPIVDPETMFGVVEPPHSFVRQVSTSLVHHADYLGGRDDRSLCGVALLDSETLSRTGDADPLCPDCEAKLIEYHLEWWRARAKEATAELEVLRVKYRNLAQSADTESADVPATDAVQVQVGSAEPAPDEATTLLDRARRELTELCRQFDGTVPFYRLNNTMQDFSDKLDDDGRLLLAQEIGSDSSLIRWATTEVESYGSSVTNNRVQESSDMMWQDWLEESQQAPKTKRRFGRSR